MRFSLSTLLGIGCLLLGGVPDALAANVTLSGVFTDHMVLQRDKPVQVWGKADAGTKVLVKFAKQEKAAVADAKGDWKINLDPMPANATGQELIVESTASTDQRTQIKDVLIGDVWLCSGQSNMAYRMKQIWTAKEDIAKANEPTIRFIRVEEQFAQAPSQKIGGAWMPVNSATVGDCSAVGFYFAQSLQEHQNVPIGLLVSSVGGTRIETWTAMPTLQRLGLTTSLINEWKDISPDEFEKIVQTYRAYQTELYGTHAQAVREAKAQGKPVPPEPKRPEMRPHDCPAALHNGMIAPLRDVTIRGVLWYQGESNAGQGKNYEKLLPALIADWRNTWGSQVPFLSVQIAPHKSIHPSFREAQFNIWQSTVNSALVVTTDVGDANDIHPAFKRPVGQRLALAARAISYGEKVEYRGPAFEKLTIKGDQAVVSFKHTADGLVAQAIKPAKDAASTAAAELRGFEIAGSDGKFVEATAVIQGATVVVTSPQVPKPTAVRYGWAHVPECNLANSLQLPAFPFRSNQGQE
jgi:sialate O-acetylesterase